MNDEREIQERPSRSAKRRVGKASEELARALADLPEGEFGQLELPEVLRQELELTRRTRGHGSRKRQIKHLAGALRRYEEEAELLRQGMGRLNEQHRTSTTVFHHLELLRDRLCGDGDLEQILEEVCQEVPGTDVELFRRLARAARLGNDRRAYREIFRRLRDASTTES